ncbi:hypothetical protein LJC14_02300 [Treponema sp. OttesenSCG-928-L16]|nr:hypothetical protein [Treponema sp. OttesenSCG-928-L16]
MNLYESISRRKSCRKYQGQPLSPERLEEIEKAIQGFTPLYPDVPLDHRLTQAVKGLFHVEAPHYLIVSGRGNSGEAENTGFLFQQLVLWFDAHDIGSVWLGASKDAAAKRSGKDIIAIGFGPAAEPVHRTAGEFKRRPIEEITNAPEDECVQAVHLAPSGMNTQPWYLEKQDGRVLVYKQKLKAPVSLVYKHSDIDMGIGLCHYALACGQTGKAFHFSRETKLPAKGGYLPFGIIT